MRKEAQKFVDSQIDELNQFFGKVESMYNQIETTHKYLKEISEGPKNELDSKDDKDRYNRILSIARLNSEKNEKEIEGALKKLDKFFRDANNATMREDETTKNAIFTILNNKCEPIYTLLNKAKSLNTAIMEIINNDTTRIEEITKEVLKEVFKQFSEFKNIILKDVSDKNLNMLSSYYNTNSSVSNKLSILTDSVYSKINKMTKKIENLEDKLRECEQIIMSLKSIINMK